jgi:alpha-tubulin suppressor-like RCC1 family protein
MFYALYIDSENRINIWGDNSLGIFGLPESKIYLTPQILNNKFIGSIKKLVCSAYAFLILTEDGNVYALGRNAYNAFGSYKDDQGNITSPTLVKWEKY